MITSEEKIEKSKSEIKQSINSIAFGVILAFVLTLSEIYRSFSQVDISSLQIVSLAIDFVAGLLLLSVPVMLKKESKHALTFLLLALGLGWSRLIFNAEAFSFNFVSIIFIIILAWFIFRFLKWVRVGALR